MAGFRGSATLTLDTFKYSDNGCRFPQTNTVRRIATVTSAQAPSIFIQNKSFIDKLTLYG